MKVEFSSKSSAKFDQWNLCGESSLGGGGGGGGASVRPR